MNEERCPRVSRRDRFVFVTNVVVFVANDKYLDPYDDCDIHQRGSHRAAEIRQRVAGSIDPRFTRCPLPGQLNACPGGGE